MHARVACLVPLPACLVRGVHGTVALERLRLIPVIEVCARAPRGAEPPWRHLSY